MPWLQIGQTLLLIWVPLSLYAIFAPQKLHTGYDGRYYYMPMWRLIVCGSNLLAALVAILWVVLTGIWA